MVHGVLIAKSIKNLLRNIVPKQLQSIQMSTNPLSMMMNPPLKMAPNVLPNVVVLESLHAIENGKKRIFVRDGTKLDESKMAAWDPSQLCSRENLCFGVASAMAGLPLETLDQTVKSERYKI